MIKIMSVQRGSIKDLLRKNKFKKVRGENRWINEESKYIINIVEKDKRFNICQIPYLGVHKVPDKGTVVSADITTIRLIAGDWFQGEDVSYAEAYWKLFFWLYENLESFNVPSIKYKKE